MNDFEHLLIIQRNYAKACTLWKRVLEDLSQIQKFNESLPTLLMDREDHRAAYPFADVKVYCHFTFANQHGVLLFGYSQKNKMGFETDTLTSIAFFDQSGYVKATIDEKQPKFHITSQVEMQEFIFERLNLALEKRFKDVLAMTIADV